jgi:hypothetical protein
MLLKVAVQIFDLAFAIKIKKFGPFPQVFPRHH